MAKIKRHNGYTIVTLTMQEFLHSRLPSRPDVSGQMLVAQYVAEKLSLDMAKVKLQVVSPLHDTPIKVVFSEGEDPNGILHVLQQECRP